MGVGLPQVLATPPSHQCVQEVEHRIKGDYSRALRLSDCPTGFRICMRTMVSFLWSVSLFGIGMFIKYPSHHCILEVSKLFLILQAHSWSKSALSLNKVLDLGVLSWSWNMLRLLGLL